MYGSLSPHLCTHPCTHHFQVQAATPDRPLFLRFAAYLARNPKTCTNAQHPHRDLDADLFTTPQLTLDFWSDFTNIVGDQDPEQEGRGWFTPRSAHGMPKPWHELPMPHKEGHSLTINSLFVHAGGAQPQGMTGPCVVAVVSLTGQQLPKTHDPGPAALGADYNTSGPCERPLWAPRYAAPAGTVPRCSACT